MRELDELLVRYLEQRYPSAPDEEKAAFRSLLELSDPELVSYVLSNVNPPAHLDVVVKHILDRTYA